MGSSRPGAVCGWYPGRQCRSGGRGDTHVVQSVSRRGRHSVVPAANVLEVHTADSTGRRNTSDHGGVRWHGVSRQADRALRPAMRSPGRPKPARRVQRAFWRLIATGQRTVEAATRSACRRRSAVRWFRHAGGMPPLSLDEPTGRYLSFAEREEIALLRGPGPRRPRDRPRARARPRRRSRASCGATPRPAAASRTTGPWSRSGRRSWRRSARRRRSW